MRPIEIEHDGLILRGTRYAGAGRGTVLLAHGFGGDRIGPGRLLVEFARALAQEGLDVLAFDRAGHGESDGAFFDISVPDEIGQLSAMADLAGGPVHLAGHSLGGMELATLAGRRPGTVRSVTLWAPAAASVDDIASGAIMGKPIDPLRRGEAFDFAGQALGPAFLEGMTGYDAFEGLAAYDGPVHLHHGRHDEVVDPRYSERYAEIWPQATLSTYDGTDHGWSNLDARRRLIETSVAQIAAAAS
ncbi:alpha/beta fold hydrolase [Roseicyclus sp. F158]|uniref:Alpha/beta fold hydrolase n=1 Tax=Tropicimonas omnivorans TaxID=3075590 RepID=A0ABU3DJD3_9RHOB|nr:alpha/beta fold hydrolase [Roseicyclus sp. F158]MDT0683639.1 alpha/beta fold hydrolase [Roseicyclus sp. F158]